MNWLKSLKESYDRFVVAGLIVAVVVWLALPAGHPHEPGLGRLWTLTVVPLTAGLIAWGNRLFGALLFVYGAVTVALALFLLVGRGALSVEQEAPGVDPLWYRWLICLLTVGLGGVSAAVGAFVSAQTFPKYCGQWERARIQLTPKFSRPSRRTLVWLTPLALLILVCALSFATNPYDHKLEVAKDAYIGIGNGQISFFSSAEGPYNGSIIALSDGVSPPKYDKIGFSFPGIYYRWFDFRPGKLWVLTFSLLFPIALAAIPAELWLVNRIKRRGRPAVVSDRPRFQFRLRGALYGMFWFCAAAALLRLFAAAGIASQSRFAAGGAVARIEFYLAVIALGLAVGAVSKRMATAALIAATIISPFVILDLLDHPW